MQHFSEQFLRAIEQLSIDARPPAKSGIAHGAHRGRAVGASIDFRDYRPYTAGDDLRRVDWNVYQRSGHFFLRRFEQPTAIPVRVLIDNSPSMFVETPSRYATAARAALAIAAAALQSGDPLTVWPFASESAPPLRSVTGRGRLPDVVAYLNSLNLNPSARLSNAVNAAAAMTNRAGLMFIISDFFDEAGVDSLCQTLAAIQHQLVLVQVTQPTDSKPDFEGDALLVDCENDNNVSVSATSSAVAEYLRLYNAYQQRLTSFASERGIRFVPLSAADGQLDAISQLFPNGILRVGSVA